MKDGTADSRNARNIAYFLLAIYGLTHFALFYFDTPIGNRETLGRSLGTLENILLVMAGYFYGSSVGSRAKDKPIIDPEAGPIRTNQTETTTTTTATQQEAKEKL